eukprot:9053078-Prorocentrum_lima.AAC.1
MVVELAKEKLVMHQRPYLECELKKRGLLAPNFGKRKPARTKSRTLPTRRQRNATVQSRAAESTYGSWITTVVGTEDQTR